MSNQTSTTDSTFKMPMAPPVYPSQSEALLFQDIIEEKTIALHSILNDFLKVHPYRKFDIEFNMFLKRVKRIIIDGHRAGANVSRITNSSHIAPLYARPSASFNYRPSTSFNYRPPTTMSMVSSSDQSMLRLPENNFHSIEPSELSNPFKPPDCLQPKVVLTRIEQSSCDSHKSPSTSSTVMKVSQNHNVTVEENNTLEIAQHSKSLSTNQPTARNTYSDVTFEENKSISESHKNENMNDDNNSIESLLEDVGFKIIVGLTENKNETSKKSNASQHQNNQLNVLENVEKFLSMWSLNMKLIKSSEQSSKFVLILTGNLLGEDKQTVVEKRHEAGVLEGRKENSLVKTKNGLYRLVGNIIGGSPNELYQTCISVNGIPRTWRKIVKQLTGVENKTKQMFDFSISSPAGPIAKPIKSAVNLDASMTRKGTTYSKNMTLANHKTNIKRKLSEYAETEHNKIKHRRFCEHTPLLLASTPKKPKKQSTMFETPSQILRKKISQNLNNNPNKRQKLDSVNDSININKRRQSHLKEQINIFLKPKTPEKTLMSSINNTKHTNQTSVNKSEILNSYKSSATKSKNNTLENSSVTKNHTKQQSKMKTTINSTNSSVDISKIKTSLLSKSKENKKTINSTNSSVDHSKLKTSLLSKNKETTNSNNSSVDKSKLKTSLLSKSKENEKTIKQKTPQIPKSKTATRHVSIVKEIKKKNVSGSAIALHQSNNKCVKAIRSKTNKCDESFNSETHKKLKVDKSKTKQMHCPNSSSTESDLFGCIDHADYGNVSDFNFMASPGKLSVASGNDQSRSVTPPLFSYQWNSTAKPSAISEPPTPLSKSIEAKALKRVKAPKITLEDEIKYNKKRNTKRSIDFKTASDKINKMLEFGNDEDEED
ncbi:uncharacterized protein LOC132950441 [Metopolophium dirhodum]|uniref:uncharacterized protein LOC132950441 n=1 Tax=Metopolophium dirhodum TaxID=44670 RepID=UPI00298F5691|nr:uncharacterized protein LOC132950441 [Metopolophium dirhodum]XP_060877889.1 uncharacterized protein LOC132950441 [Metopolophium dirhodum]